MSIESLSRDVLIHILSFVDVHSIETSTCRVSKAFYQASRAESLWEALYLSTVASLRGAAVKEEKPKKATLTWRNFFFSPHRMRFVQSYRQGSLSGPLPREIQSRLAVPTHDDDPSKVRYSWVFWVFLGDAVHTCAIWDWKGSYEWQEYSFFGPTKVMLHLFPDAKIRE